MMEEHQPFRSLCRLKDSVIEYQVTFIKEEPASCCGGHHGDADMLYHTQHYPSAHIKQEPFPYEGERVMYPHRYTPTGPTQMYTSPYIKEEPDLYDRQHVGHIQCIKEEADSCDGGDLYIQSGHTLQYPAAHVKMEPDSGDRRNITYHDHNKPTEQRPRIKEDPPDGQNLPDPIIYTQYPPVHTYAPADHTSPYPSPHVKEEPMLRDEGSAIDLTLYTPADHTQNIKEESASSNERNVHDPNTYTLMAHTLHIVKEDPFSCHIMQQSKVTEHYPSAHIKEDPEPLVGGLLQDTEIHTQKITSGFDDEETDSCDEGDVSDVHTTPVNRGIALPKNNTDHSQNGDNTTQPTDVTSKCLECEMCFTSKSDFEEHLALHRGKKTHVCSHCGKCFSYQSQRLIHERTHTGEKPFMCSECGKCFNQYVHLAIHLMSHTGEKPYVCSECGKSFNRKTTLTIHQRIHTGEKPFHCSQCGKYFSTSSNLIKHQRVHTGEKPYSCSQCGELFVHYTQLIRHQANHSSEKPFSCLQCGKSFSQKAQFLRHERFHKADNTYSCSECNQCFKQYKDLLVHQSAHAGQSPFKCRECGKHFDKKWTLVSHQRLHSGEKPYSCSDCGKSFCLSSNLDKHQQVHVQEKLCPEGGEQIGHQAQTEGYQETQPFPVCGEQFREDAALAEHMRMHR